MPCYDEPVRRLYSPEGAARSRSATGRTIIWFSARLATALFSIDKSFVSGSAVSLATSVALAALARAEGRGAVQPVNSTSHWYAGEDAGRSRAIDLRHTLGGLATYQAASVFWAMVFEAARRYRPNRAPLGDAVAVSALAARRLRRRPKTAHAQLGKGGHAEIHSPRLCRHGAGACRDLHAAQAELSGW